MANKIISNLTPKTSPAAADVLAIEDTEATKKIDYNALADAILNKITSKTYSVAGSTQTLISAIDALNSNLGNSLSDGTNLDSLTLPANSRRVRYYHAQNIKSMTGYPTGVEIGEWPFCLELIPIGSGGTYTKQVLHLYGTYSDPDRIFERTQTYVSGSTSWSPWVQHPTRKEISTLNNSLTPLVNNISVSDLDDATVHNKVYYFNAGAAHNPGYNYGMVAVWKEANNINQMAWPRGGVGSTSESMSRRSKNGNTGEWGEWVKQPTRAEVDALNNRIQKYTNNITVGNSCTFTLIDKINRFHYGLLVGGTEGNPYLAHVFVNTQSGSYKVTVSPYGSPIVTVTGAYDSSTGDITFTVTAGTAFGGFRFVDLS